MQIVDQDSVFVSQTQAPSLQNPAADLIVNFLIMTDPKGETIIPLLACEVGKAWRGDGPDKRGRMFDTKAKHTDKQKDSVLCVQPSIIITIINNHHIPVRFICQLCFSSDWLHFHFVEWQFYKNQEVLR